MASTKIKNAIIVPVSNGLKLAVGNTSEDNQASAISVSGLKTFIDSDKATVATTGSYNDLVDTPNLNNYALITTLNSNFYNKSEVNNLINGIHTIEFKVVDSLPPVGENNIIYLILNESQGYQNIYDEYIWIPESESYEQIGTTQTDLSNYYTKSEVNNLIPSVGNGTIIINQDGVQKGTFTLNQNNNAVIEIESSSFIQEQSDWTEQDPESPKYIQNKPEIESVGDGTITLKMGETLLGSFSTNQTSNDTITIPETSQLQSNWNEGDSNSPQYILNKPTIPTVNNPTINFSQGGVLKGSITLNQSSNATIFLDGGGSGSGEVQANWNETDPTSLAYIQNKPTLATVAISGSYNDLLDTPTIPTAVQSDWTESDSSSIAFIKHKPTIYDSTITIQQGGVTKGTFTLNQSTGTTINLEGGGGGGSTQVQSNWTESDTTAVSYIQNKPTLATVATSGSYSDLSNTPSLATVATSGDYDDLTNKPTIPSSSDFVTLNTNQTITGTKTFGSPILVNTSSYDARILTTLSNVTIGTAPSSNGIVGFRSADSLGREFANINCSYNTQQKISSNFYVNNQNGVTGKLGIFIDNGGTTAYTEAPTPATSDNSTKIATTAFVKAQGYATSSSLSTVATSGSYSDLSNKPTIPSNTRSLLITYDDQSTETIVVYTT